MLKTKTLNNKKEFLLSLKENYNCSNFKKISVERLYNYKIYKFNKFYYIIISGNICPLSFEKKNNMLNIKIFSAITKINILKKIFLNHLYSDIFSTLEI